MGRNVRSSRRSGSRKAKRTLSSGQIHINARFNNTIITVTDNQGNTVAWSSAGAVGFQGSRKSTPFAARLATEQALRTARDLGLQEAEIIVKGPGPGREASLRAIASMDLRIRSITDVTPIPHNGCRPPKKRRV